MIPDPKHSFGVELGDTLIVLTADTEEKRDEILLALLKANIYTIHGWGDRAGMVEDKRSLAFRRFRSFQYTPIFQSYEDYTDWKTKEVAKLEPEKLPVPRPGNVVPLNNGQGDPGDEA
jgi:hypothetical protein